MNKAEMVLFLAAMKELSDIKNYEALDRVIERGLAEAETHKYDDKKQKERG